MDISSIIPTRRMDRTMVTAIKNIMVYNSMKGDKKIQYLHMVDGDLKLLLVLVGVARSQKYITEKKALELQEKISELGRITGGMIKSHSVKK